MSREALQEAIDATGGSQSVFAEQIKSEIGADCRVRQGHVWKWLNQARPDRVPPAEYVLVIEKISGVSRHELRPDLYPLQGAA